MVNKSMCKRSKKYCLSALMIMLLPLGSVQAEVETIEFEHYGSVNNVSADGTVIVGSHSTSIETPLVPEGYTLLIEEPFYWTASGGIVGLGKPLEYEWGSPHRSEAFGVSSDGSVIVGYGTYSHGFEAFRWTQEEGMIGLGDLDGGDFVSAATAISSNGSVIVGLSFSENGQEAFRWTEEEGMVGLGDLIGGECWSHALGVSSDGSVIVGYGTSENGQEAFRWTEDEGMVGLGDLEGGDFWSQAYDVSADGSVIVGFGSSGENWSEEAFRWTAEDGLVGLGDLAGGEFWSRAYGVSADGKVIVGFGNSEDGQEAFRWTVETGMQSVEEWLLDYGVDTKSLHFEGAVAISDNGIIVGNAINSIGADEIYYAKAGGLLFVSDYLSSFQQVNHAQSVSQRISRQIMPTQPFDSFFHRSVSQEKRSSLEAVRYASNNITPEIYVDQGRDLAQGELSIYPIFSYSKWGDDSMQRAGAGIIYSKPTWYLNLEPSTSKADSEADNSGHQDVDGVHFALSGGLSVGGVFNMPGIKNLLISAGVAKTIQDADISRRYLNGASYVDSEGDTDIDAMSYSIQAGWQLPLSDQFSIRPYVSALYSEVEMDNYLETGGSFPGLVSTDPSRSLETKLGLKLNWNALSNLQMSGWVSWSNLDVKTDNKTTIIPSGLGAMSTTAESYDNNWYEGGVSANWQIADSVGLYTTLSTSGGSDYPADFSFNLALSLGF